MESIQSQRPDVLKLPAVNAGKTRRIVAVQGAVQLVSALAAMRASDRLKPKGEIENHLIVHDLSSPGEQGAEFASCLHDLAKQVDRWATLHFLPLEEMLRLQGALKEGSWELATATLRSLLGFDHCDEIYFGQNLLFINNLMARTYPEAEKACYGDGIGINFTADYYSPVAHETPGIESLGKRFERSVRHWIKRMRGKLPTESSPPLPMKSKKHAVPFDKHYLLIANQLDEVRENYVPMSPQDFVDAFATFAKNLDRYSQDTGERLERALANASQIVCLLTSNFSETKRMTLEGEIESNMELVNRLCNSKDALLVIKPHPRDSHEKIAELERQAAKRYRSVVTLNDPWTFYVPFESIYQRYIANHPLRRRITSVACSSSACLSLEYFYGQRCLLGFGQRAVNKHFANRWQTLRMRHETDLLRLTEYVRKQVVQSRAA